MENSESCGNDRDVPIFEFSGIISGGSKDVSFDFIIFLICGAAAGTQGPTCLRQVLCP